MKKILSLALVLVMVLGLAACGSNGSTASTTAAATDAAAGISIHLTSPVLKKFGSAIRSVLAQELTQAGLTQVEVTANDRGALDCTIRARILTAIERGLTKEEQ